MTDESKDLQVIKNFEDVLQSTITESQFTILRGRTPKLFIKTRPGKGGKNFDYVPHGYVTSILNQAFGFDWDFELIPVKLNAMYEIIPEEQGIRPASVIVHGKLTVRVRNPKSPTEIIATISKSSTGEKEVIKGMTWGGMIKSAESDAFKKAASRLGVALDLYWEDPTGEFVPEDKEYEKLKIKVKEVLSNNKGKSLPDLVQIVNNALEIELTIGEISKFINEL